MSRNPQRPIAKAIVLVHPEPQNDEERYLVARGLPLKETVNYQLFTRIGKYLDRNLSKYQYGVYLPAVYINQDPVWDSPFINPSIRRHQNILDLINVYSLEEQAIILK